MRESKEKFRQPPSGGFGRLKHDGAATVAELREFLIHVRGKSPQEVMGTIAGNSLVKSTLIALVGTVLFLFVTSALVYFVTPDNSKTAKAKPAEAAAAKIDAPDQTDGKKADAKTNADLAKSDKSEKTIKSDDKTLQNLGVGETKIAPPDKNPLDKKLEDLLNKKID